MVDVIDFKDKKSQPKEIPNANSKELLEDLVQDSLSFKDIAIFIKDTDDAYSLFYSNSLNIADKSVLIQLLQHDIFQELESTEDIILEPNQ